MRGSGLITWIGDDPAEADPADLAQAVEAVRAAGREPVPGGPAHLEGVAQRLAEVPPPERALTQAEALRRLAPVLRRMRQAGHTPASIRAARQERGLRVSEKTLRKLLGSRSTRPATRKAAVGGAVSAEAEAPR